MNSESDNQFFLNCFTFSSSLWLPGREDGLLFRYNIGQVSVRHWRILQDEERGATLFIFWMMLITVIFSHGTNWPCDVTFSPWRSEGRGEGGEPAVGGGRAILWAPLSTGGRRWGHRCHRDAARDSGPPWPEPPGSEREPAPVLHHHGASDRHSNLGIKCLFLTANWGALSRCRGEKGRRRRRSLEPLKWNKSFLHYKFF